MEGKWEEVFCNALNLNCRTGRTGPRAEPHGTWGWLWGGPISSGVSSTLAVASRSEGQQGRQCHVGPKRWWWHYGFASSPVGDLVPTAKMPCSCTRSVMEQCALEKLGCGAWRGRTSWSEGTVPRASTPCHTYGQSFRMESCFHRFDFCREGVFLALVQSRLRSWSLQIVPFIAWLHTCFVQCLGTRRSLEDLCGPGDKMWAGCSRTLLLKDLLSCKH